MRKKKVSDEGMKVNRCPSGFGDCMLAIWGNNRNMNVQHLLLRQLLQ